jgi:hypothetical protein
LQSKASLSLTVNNPLDTRTIDSSGREKGI